MLNRINTLVRNLEISKIVSIFARVLIYLIEMKLKYVILLILINMSIISLFIIHIDKLKQDIIYYDNNIKALNSEKDSLSNNILAYKLSIEELEIYNDSIINDLNIARKELKIKDKQLLQMQSIKTETTIKDSIVVKDTIFKKDFIKIDTTLSNEWYTLNFKLEYPSSIKVEAFYKSDLNVFAYSKKEILGVPKKCFIGRLFQKKYNVIRVEVHDKNPHSIIKESKFIIIE